jgi:5'-3' exonuclease
LDGLYKKEEILLKDMYDDHRHFRPRLNPNISQYEARVTMLNYYPTMMAEKDTIHLGQPGWRERLYKYWLEAEPDKYMINGMCENYLEGLSWILQYYLKGCPSQMWYYKFPITPSIKDLLVFCSQKTDRYYKMEWDTANDENYNWTTYQLLLAIPKSSIRCIPKELRTIVQHRYFWYLFPTTFKLKTLYKRYYHDCYPVLPRLENNILKNILEIAVHHN